MSVIFQSFTPFDGFAQIFKIVTYFIQFSTACSCHVKWEYGLPRYQGSVAGMATRL
jgi:hypothetical protein